MGDLAIYQTPDVAEYERLKPYERARVRHLIGLNARLLAEQAQTIEDAIEAVKVARAQEIARIKSEARQSARAEMAALYQDEYSQERVRAFEGPRVILFPHGDLEACTAEAADYDKRNRKT